MQLLYKQVSTFDFYATPASYRRGWFGFMLYSFAFYPYVGPVQTEACRNVQCDIMI
jgi:hypothetical protein